MHERLTAGAFFGRSLSRREAGGFLFAESAFGPDTRIPAHVHENPFFYLVLEGRCAEHAGGEYRETGPATLVFHPAGEPHSDCWPEGGRCFHLEIPAPLLGKLGEEAPVISNPAVFQGPGPAALARRAYAESRSDDPLSGLVLQGLVLELLGEASRAAARTGNAPPRWLGTVRDFLNARFAEALTLEEIAAAGGVHPAHLNRVFRRHHGCTVGDYVRGLRVDYASVQLASSATPLLEIALDSGFSDQSHLTRCFKSLTGTTPAEYRRRQRGR